MKKTNKLFVAMLMAGSFAMLFGSCKKEETSSEYLVSVPEFQVEEEDMDRAYIDMSDKKFKWNANDEIAIYNLSAVNFSDSKKAIYTTNAAAEGKEHARFALKDGEEAPGTTALDAGYFVFYPAEKVTKALYGENVQDFDVPAEQNYKAVNGKATVAPEGMALASTLGELGGGFEMQHIFGILRLKYKGTGNVTKIVIEDDQYYLNGTVSMKLHGVQMTELQALAQAYLDTDEPLTDDEFQGLFTAFKEHTGYSTAGEGKTMTLNCNVPLNTSTDQLFFIGLRPGALKYGFKVYVYKDNGTTPAVTYDYTGTANPKYGIRPGVIKGIASKTI
jgi:hypothetical protein